MWPSSASGGVGIDQGRSDGARMAAVGGAAANGACLVGQIRGRWVGEVGRWDALISWASGADAGPLGVAELRGTAVASVVGSARITTELGRRRFDAQVGIPVCGGGAGRAGRASSAADWKQWERGRPNKMGQMESARDLLGDGLGQTR